MQKVSRSSSITFLVPGADICKMSAENKKVEEEDVAAKGDKISARGITFRVATKKDREEVWKLVKPNFFKEEPMAR